MVIQMVPSRALSADVGSYIFGGIDGRIGSFGVKMNKHRHGKDLDKKLKIPLVTKWHGEHCQWPITRARKMFGFCEVIPCAT